MLRVIRNRGRIGKRWLVVVGHWTKASVMANIKPALRWVTVTQLAEFNTKSAADNYLVDLIHHRNIHDTGVDQ